ncbi:uncharacterized protein [Spinacia oleracea]|uniref:Uncharacterized protein n=1 Tax=Spinacia oleracea TaxID=3562 RepID=A0ABM3RJI7_SPIOL|nr:uncharacterized protein LOC130470172 [Spinacia oleracea]
MDRLSPEDKGVVEVPAWLSEEPTLPAMKKRPASSTEAPKPKRPFFKKMGPADAVTKPSVPKPSAPLAEGEVPPIQTPILPPEQKEVPSQEPTLPAMKKRPASSTEAPKPKRPFFKKMGPADAVTKPSVPKPSAPLAEGEVPPIQTPILPPEQKEVPSQVDTEMDGTAGAAADEVAVDQTAAADATTLSREDKGKGKETEAPSTDNASTPPAASPIGWDLHDLFIRCAESRNYRFDMHNEMLKHKDQIENHEQYAEKTARLINLEADKKIALKTEELKKAEEDAEKYEEKLLEHEGRLAVLRKEYSSVLERVTDFSSKVNVLEGQLKAMQGKIEAVRKEAASSFKLGEESILESAQKAWDQSMDWKDFSWFKRRISHQIAVSTARRLGLDPPDFVSDGEEDIEEDEVNSPEGQDIQEGSSIAPHP